jgi:hypothetical protein
MNRKQLTLILLAGVVIGVAGFFLWKSNQDQWKQKTRSQDLLLPAFPVNDVAEIRIRAGTNELVLAKAESRWVVRPRADFPANFGEISDFLRKLAEMKPGDPVEIGSSQLGRLELLEPGAGTNTATKVEFKDKGGKTLGALLLGKKHMKKSEAGSPFGGGEFPEGRYVMVAGDLKSVCLLKEPFGNVEPKAETWLDREFFKIEKLKSISLAATNATNSWQITRETETGEWKLANAGAEEKLDTVKASSAGSAMMNPSFSDVLVKGASAGQTGLDQPQTATFVTFDGFTYTLKLGKVAGDEGNYPLSFTVAFAPAKERTPGKDEKPEDKDKLDKEFKDAQKKLQEKFDKEKAFEKWDYLVSKWSIEPILKPRHELMAAKPAETKPEGAPAPPPVIQ